MRHVINSYPDSEYAAASQFKKAICYEKMENFDAACEEYVKLTYVYPESGFVADATLRLGNYYYKKEKYQVAAKIFYNFKQKNPTHKMAAQALFLAAQCAMKQKTYAQAAQALCLARGRIPGRQGVAGRGHVLDGRFLFQGGRLGRTPIAASSG